MLNLLEMEVPNLLEVLNLGTGNGSAEFTESSEFRYWKWKC